MTSSRIACFARNSWVPQGFHERPFGVGCSVSDMPKALDVLHIYSGNLFGGIERMLISISKLGVETGRSTFALSFEGRLSRALRDNGARVEPIGAVRLRSPLSVLRARKALARLLAASDFDAVICHSIWVYCIFAPVIARAGYAPVLFLHDIPDPAGLLYRWAWRTPPALCIANSRATAEPLKQMKRSVPVEVVHPLVAPPPPAAPEAIRALRHELGARPEQVVILQASRFDSWKGHKNLLAALSRMTQVPGWCCWIAGTPQRPEEEAYRQELLGLVEVLGLTQHVKFIGHRDDMESVLAASDVYCQPNESPEPFGMVFIEAMYAGKPVVGRALGGALEIVSPECGMLCRAGPEPLSAALQSLVRDAELRREIARAGPARASALSGPEAFTSGFGSALASLRPRARPRR